MEYQPGKVMRSYFNEVNNNYKVITLVHDTLEYPFVLPNSKGASTTKSAIKIVDGLNHLYAWAHDVEDWDFINKLNLFFIDMCNTFKDPTFREGNLNDWQQGIYPSTAEASAAKFKKQIDNIDMDIIRGVIKYVNDNIVVNTVDDEDMDPNSDQLDNEDIFLLTCIVTLTKFMIVGVSLLERYKLEKYIYRPLLGLIDKVQDVMADYYWNHAYERGEKYQKVRSIDFKNSIYRFFYAELTKKFENNNVALFRNNGHSIDKIANDHYVTGICTIAKCNPINIHKKTSEYYSHGKNYRDYKFVNKNTVKYVKDIIHNMIGDKLGVTFGAVISILRYDRYSEQNDRYDSAIKQELMLEKKSVSDMEKRKHNIELLKLYIKDKITNENITIPEIGARPVPTPLSDFFIIKILAELSEDVLSLKLIDKANYLLLTLIIADRLEKENWHTLATALRSNQLSPSELPRQLNRFMDTHITRLKKYHINDKKCLESIVNIVGFDYKNTATNDIRHITEEFLQFLINDQSVPILLMDKYIYDYEEELEKITDLKKEDKVS